MCACQGQRNECDARSLVGQDSREAVYRTASADLLEQQPRVSDLRLISRVAAGKQVA
ncbi:hypothetical protein [Streptomyces sp. NPDC002763]|uniref:hypothetical protein n=1 Tax=Streptomyces sp. NPDC002763 TaxID=3154427 RepID=UPI003321018F